MSRFILEKIRDSVKAIAPISILVIIVSLISGNNTLLSLVPSFLLGSVLLMIGMFLFVLAIKHYKASCLYFGVATLAISMYSYVVAIYSVPIFLLILAIYLLKKNYIKIKHLMISIAISCEKGLLYGLSEVKAS